MNDPSIVNDFLAETFSKQLKMDLLTMENTPALLAHCLSLINGKYESHTLNGVKAYSHIFNAFRDVKISFVITHHF